LSAQSSFSGCDDVGKGGGGDTSILVCLEPGCTGCTRGDKLPQMSGMNTDKKGLVADLPFITLHQGDFIGICSRQMSA
jgi:hypothetical protein